ncbi:mCG1030193, partial [Mus musculus]
VVSEKVSRGVCTCMCVCGGGENNCEYSYALECPSMCEIVHVSLSRYKNKSILSVFPRINEKPVHPQAKATVDTMRPFSLHRAQDCLPPLSQMKVITPGLGNQELRSTEEVTLVRMFLDRVWRGEQG